MTALAYLHSHGLNAEPLPDGTLSISPVANITDDIRSWIREHKADVLAELVAQPSVDQHGPTKPCQCGSGTYHQTDGQWLCSACHPRTGIPAAVLTVPGSHIPAGPSRDVDLVLREAVLGLPIAADEFRDWCDPADLADMAAGLIPVSTVRAYAREAVTIRRD